VTIVNVGLSEVFGIRLEDKLSYGAYI